LLWAHTAAWRIECTLWCLSRLTVTAAPIESNHLQQGPEKKTCCK
jgi:hypothetical protein